MAPANEWSKVGGIAIWPISHIVGMINMPEPTPESIKENKPAYEVRPYHRNLTEWISGGIRIIPLFTIALICNYFYPIADQIQESTTAIEAFMSGNRDPTMHGWLLKIAIRDLIVGLTACIGWQWTIMHSPVTRKLRPVKFNKEYQDAKHMPREIYYSISTILCGTFWEAWIMFMYTQGYFGTWSIDIAANWHKWAVMILTLPYWRDGYFYWCHRAMHHWDTERIPDIGKWLYNISHSVHHRSRNIQPWSGISMHPIEGIIYESACLLPLMFIHHPIMYNLVKIDLNYAAVLGHDGHEYPAHGDWFHYIHHVKVKGNYGSPNCPFDWLFGTVDNGDDILKGDIAANTLAYEEKIKNESVKYK